MRLLALAFVIFYSKTLIAAEMSNDLIASALEGDKTSRLHLAEMFANPEHKFYYPKKSLDMYVSLAWEGHSEAFEPLSNMFSDPNSEFYDPARSITYLSKLPEKQYGHLLLNEILSYRTPISRLKDELANRKIRREDLYYDLLQALSFFPFESASSSQRKALLRIVNQPAASPFLRFIYPPLMLPVAGQKHVLEVARAELEGDTTPSLSWYQEQMTNKWYPVTETNGIQWLKFIWEPDEWRGKRLVAVLIAYPLEAKLTLLDYYADTMATCEDGLCLPGIFLRFHEEGGTLLNEFIFTAEKPLLRPSRLPTQKEQLHAIPRMLYSNVIEAKRATNE